MIAADPGAPPTPPPDPSEAGIDGASLNGGKLTAPPVPPQNIEAEVSVLGAMLVVGQAVDEVLAAGLQAQHFYFDKHAEIFRCIRDLRAAGKAADEVAVTDQLQRAGQVQGVGGKHYVAELAAKVGAPSNAKHHAEIVMSHAETRRILGAVQMAGEQLAERNGETPAELHAQVERLVVEARPGAAARQSAEIVPAQAFAAVDEPGAEPLLGEPGEAVIPQGGDVMLYGDGGASKTTLSIDLACHLAAGDPWLGIPIPKAVRVLLIEAEGPRPLFRLKLAAKLKQWGGADLDDRLLVHEAPWADFSFPDAEGVAKQIAEREIDVLVVGPLTRVGMDELGTLQQVRDFTAHVARFRAQSGRRLTVLLVHHQSKSGAVSGAWEGAGDTLLHAQVHAQGRTMLTFQKARWASAWHKRALELGWKEGEGFEVVDEDERDYPAEIEELLRQTGEWMTDEEIRQPEGGIGASRKEVREALKANPERFACRTGDDAKAVGRSPRATVWQLVRASKRVERVGRPQGDPEAHSFTRSPLRGTSETSESPPEQAELDRDAERVRTSCSSHAEPVDACRYCRTGEAAT